MLRFDHSKKILEGLLGDHVIKNAANEPSYSNDGNLEYGINSVSFPKPSASIAGDLKFTISDTVEYPKVIFTKTLTEEMCKNLDHKSKFLVIWDSFEYECIAYMDSKERGNLRQDTDRSTKTYYIGNGSFESHNGSIEEYDTRVPFFVKIANKQVTVTTNLKNRETHSFELHRILEPTIYLGLSTTSPNPQGGNFTEPSDSEGELWPEYKRIRINTNSSFDKNLPLLTSAAIDAEGKVEVHNTDMILFPEAVGDTNTGWGRVTHFGLFYGNEKSERPEDQTPFLWGEILDENGEVGVNIGHYEVPVIRKDSFQISLQ